MHNLLNIEPEAFEFDANELEQSSVPASRPGANPPLRPARKKSARAIRFPDDSPGFAGRSATNSEFAFEAEAFSFQPEWEADQTEAYPGEMETNEFEAAPAPAVPAQRRMVNPAKVSCARRNRSLPLFRAIGTNDPVGQLEIICQRAVGMLDNTIAEMRRIRERVQAGDPPAPPLIADQLIWSLQTRMLMRATEARAWTGRGPRTAEQIIRWLTNIRKTIAGGSLWYTCLDAQKLCGPARNELCCGSSTWAWVFPGRLRVHLCRRFWNAANGIDAATHLEFQAQTMIHEVSHIYYFTEDSGRGPGHAECISQFVAEANNSPIDSAFINFCGGSAPTRPQP